MYTQDATQEWEEWNEKLKEKNRKEKKIILIEKKFNL